MNENVKIQTESKSIIDKNLPWYKRKNTIIASSSILGAGVLATVIAVPIALSNQTTTIKDNSVLETINLLNVPENKDTRINLWNSYIEELVQPIAKKIILEEIVKTPEFINEFISFLTSNLYVTTAGTEAGSVTQVDLDKIIKEISNATNKAIFENTTGLVTYTNLFVFNGNSVMFNFKNDVTTPTIEFSLSMPVSGLDLTYNDDETISIKINKIDTTATNNVRLSIKTFNDPVITTAKDIYFKQEAIIKLPTTIIGDFKTFLKTSTQNEIAIRNKINNSWNTIKTSIDKDVSNITGLSYWNSFAINYATSNNAFLKEDFKKEVVVGSMYKFLAKNAKNGNTNITPQELDLIKKQLIVDATNGLNNSPFIVSPINTNLLFNTINTVEDKYSLELNITKFSYEFIVNNLFTGSKAIVITPQLELSGKLIKTPQSGATTTFTIANSLYDVGDLINMTFDGALATGGLSGFLIDLTNPKANDLSKLTYGLVALNSKTTNEQIKFWNTFAKETSNNALILDELKKENVLADFILNNIDITNLVGTTETGGALPTIIPTTLKTAINTVAAALTTTDLSFTNPGVVAITLTPTTGGIQYGPSSTDDLFATITLYLGYDANSISNINFTVKLDTDLTTGTSNISLSQMIELTKTYADKAAVEEAAKKRISVVFDKTTTGSSKTSTSVAYFGQGKIVSGTDTTPTTKSIIIPSSILTSTTKLIDAIKILK